MKPERWMRPALLASGVAVTASGLAFGYFDHDGGTVLGVLVIGLLMLVIAVFEPRLEEMTASLGDKIKFALKMQSAKDALTSAQAIAEAVKDRAEQLEDPDQLRDVIASTSEAIDSIAEDFVLSGPEMPVFP